MASIVGIVNLALKNIGATRISSLTSGEKNAVSASLIYDEHRQNLLRGHNWNFAQTDVKLARRPTDPIIGFEYAYSLPSNWLRTVDCYDNASGIGSADYVERDGAIFANSENIWMSYVFDCTDPNRMTADFRMALASDLSIVLAIDIAQSNTLHESWKKQAIKDLIKAKSSDAQGSAPDVRPSGSWVNARNGWRRPRQTTTS